MKNRTSWILGPFVAVTAAILLLAGSVAAQEWVEAPEDQAALENENVTFTADPRFDDLDFQWLRQWPDKVELLRGETRSSLTLSKVGISDVGHYLCAVMKGDEIQLTPAASLTVGVRSTPGTSGKKSLSTQTFGSQSNYGEALTLFGPPVVNSGSQGSCPGPYAGYVNYMKPVSQGWGWVPSAETAVHTASDTIRTDTTIQYGGKYGDTGCQQSFVTIPHPPISPKYRFTIYFPNNVPSTNAYPITLVGFDP